MSHYKFKKQLGLNIHLSQAAKVLVRCLGPIAPEHSFYSVDKCCNRICPRCTRLAAYNEQCLPRIAVVHLSNRVSIRNHD